jgi:DNA-binding PadR family transcriptional regulator
LARKKCRGNPLKVFSGKEAGLNRLVLQIFEQRGLLIPYDVWRFVVQTKDFGGTDRNSVNERIEALAQGDYITQTGTRPTKSGRASGIFELTERGKAALKADKKSMNEFIETESKEVLRKFNEIY